VTCHVLFLFEGGSYPLDVRIRSQTGTLTRGGYEVTVIAPTAPHSSAPAEDVDGVHVRRFRPPPGGRGAVGYVREFAVALVRIARLARAVDRERPVDLVIACNPPDLLVLSALPLMRRGARLLFDARELSPELFEAKFRRRGVMHRLLLGCERWALRRADAVIAVSQGFVDILRERCRLPAERVFLVGNGPDPQRVYPVEPRPELRHGREHLVLWLGVMSTQDGLERLIAAADELVNRGGRADVTFALVGDGDAEDDLRAEVRRRGLEEVVFFEGLVRDEGVRAFISTADVCVGTDVCVGMNDRTMMRKIIEYMAIGRPVVQFPLREMKRICGDSAVYARDADSADLARQIGALLDDPERRRRLGEAAQARAHSGLMWPQQEPALLAALRAALQRSR
jgi:glycosyltransferase involved in cell wall biosynthesis